MDGIKDYQKSIFNDEYLKDAFTDIENMVAAVELEGKNASKCVEWGKFIGGEVKKHYYNDTEVCYNRQKENLNNIYDSLQQVRNIYYFFFHSLLMFSTNNQVLINI